MQLDRPAKRRPRAPNRQNPNRDTERRQNSSKRADPFPQPSDPFQPIQRTALGDPFQPRNAATPLRQKRGTAPRFPARAPAPPQDPFQPLPAAPAFSAPSRAEPVSFVDPAFGQNITFAQNANHFRQPAQFGQNAATIGHTPPTSSQDPFAPAPSFAQKAGPFGQKPTPFGQNITPFGQSSNAFGQKVTPFGQTTAPFDQNVSTGAEQVPQLQGTPEVKQTRTQTRRRRRDSASSTSFEYKPAASSRGQDVSEADLELDHDSYALQPTADSDREKPQSSRSDQLLLKSVPISLFSRTALQRHFSSIPGVQVTRINFRGSKRPDSRRTALITFSSERQATNALRNGQNFKGTNLQLSFFRHSAHANEQPVNETNELFFNYVPESLSSEESIKDLFNNVSENAVANVSLKEKPHYGSVKRTAIITFTSADAAAMALQNLPLYKGRTLTVSFRRTRQSNNITPATTERYDDTDGEIFSKGAAKNELHEDDELEMDTPVEFPGEYGDRTPAGYDSVLYGDEGDVNYEQVGHGEEQMGKTTIRDRQAEISKLKAEILRKEKVRSQMSQADRGKREKKLVIPKRRESSTTEQEESNSGWRKVGEKVDIKNAANFVGTCMTMCPFKEFEDRIIQRDISLFEKDDNGEPDFTKAVKKYRRSAAISEQPSPNEVRPPSVLLDTMEHLKTICDSTDMKFADIHNFVRDRTRSLRQDFTLQGVRDESCIKIHEESVRFHILSEHRLHGTDPAVFSSKQNLEQLDKCLISLREMYELRRDNDLDTSPNEPEMQAYYILTQMSDPKTCVQLCTGFAQDVRSSWPVQFALQVIRAASEGFGSFTRYFALVRSAPYLMACLMHSRFSVVRARALTVINETHGNPHSSDNIPMSALTRQLGFEDDEETEEFCRTLGMKVESVVLPSVGSEVVTIRTPSEDFDEAKLSEWESSRADNLIESKAQGMKTSNIICGSGCNDFKMTSLAKKTATRVEKEKPKPPSTQTEQFTRLLSSKAPRLTPSPTDQPKFTKTAFAPKIIMPSKSEAPTAPKQGFTPGIVFDLKPRKEEKKNDDLFKTPQSLPEKSPVPQSLKRQRTFQIAQKHVSATPSSTFTIAPSPNAAKSATNAISTPFPVFFPTKPAIPEDNRTTVPTGISVPERERNAPVEKLVTPVPEEQKDEPIEGSRRDLTAEAEAKSATLKREKTVRRASLAKLLSDLIVTSDADLEKIRKIIDDAETGTLRFPKAMEIWDDAKDILKAVSERNEHGLRELERDDSFDVDDLPKGDEDMEDLRQRLRLCYHEGTELSDQLNEIFSKSLALETAYLKESVPCISALPHAPRIPQALDQEVAFSAYGLDDEEPSFEVRKIPEREAELHAILNVMSSVDLNKWQAVIASITCLQIGENEMGIAQRWLRQRLSTSSKHGSSSLCLLDAAEPGSPSISIREVKEASTIPYTANLIVLPCDARTLELDPSGHASAWSSVEQVLRRNRSIACSHDLPPPSVIVLYYCGSRDKPSWFTDENASGHSFSRFQNSLQQKGYVSVCQKLELSGTSVFQGLKVESFIAMMNTSVRATAQALTTMGNVARPTNLRDHLVSVANVAVAGVLDTISLKTNAGIALIAIQAINESWQRVAICLRREEARWPKEMAEQRRLMTACADIEAKLQLPLPRTDCRITDYAHHMAAALGVGLPPYQELQGIFSFCSALGHLMNAFVRQRLIHCPVSVVYLVSDARDRAVATKLRSRVTYHLNPSSMKKQEERVNSRYAPMSEPQRRPKRLRDETARADGAKRAQNPVRRRLSMARIDPISPSEFVSGRRRSLPASYGRRRMFELLDGICSEEQTFDDLLQATMDALTAKRRRLEQRGEALVA